MRHRTNKFNNTAQSTVEYIILATAVMAVVLIFFNGQGSLFQGKMYNTLNQTGSGINDRGEKLIETHEAQPAQAGANGGRQPTESMRVNSTANLV